MQRAARGMRCGVAAQRSEQLTLGGGRVCGSGVAGWDCWAAHGAAVMRGGGLQQAWLRRAGVGWSAAAGGAAARRAELLQRIVQGGSGDLRLLLVELLRGRRYCCAAGEDPGCGAVDGASALRTVALMIA